MQRKGIGIRGLLPLGDRVQELEYLTEKVVGAQELEQVKGVGCEVIWEKKKCLPTA